MRSRDQKPEAIAKPTTQKTIRHSYLDHQRMQAIEEADTFSLSVQLNSVCPPTLTITLKDYVDWKLFSKEYSQKDISIQINRKIDLFDIYYALAPQTEDQQNQLLKKIKKKLRVYQFGTPIKNGDSSYTIQKGGQIKIQNKVLYKRNHKCIEQTVQSLLTLNKVSEMTQMEIFMIRHQLQKRQFAENYKDQLDELKNQRKFLYAKMEEMQRQNREIKQQMESFQKQHEKMVKFVREAENKIGKLYANFSLQGVENVVKARVQQECRALQTRLNMQIQSSREQLKKQANHEQQTKQQKQAYQQSPAANNETQKSQQLPVQANQPEQDPPIKQHKPDEIDVQSIVKNVNTHTNTNNKRVETQGQTLIDVDVERIESGQNDKYANLRKKNKKRNKY